ncbi:MAG: phospholipase D-like domain-containing protein [Alishewanella aestuarii]
MRRVITKAYFEDIGFHIFQELMKARESVKICVAWISWQKYVPIFDQLTSKGITVEVIYNDDAINKNNFYPPSHKTYLYPVRARGNALMHNKFCIIDDSTILTGSFNWSNNARFHFENIVVIENDLKLVKKFLTEYQDLKNFFSDFGQNNKLQCLHEENFRRCRLSSYNLGVLGHESGKYDESLIEIWNVCLSHEHGTFLDEHYENHLHTYLGLKDAPDYNDDLEYDKDSMRSEINQEFNQIKDIRNHFLSRSKYPIHAIGLVSVLNENQHIKLGEEQMFGINVFWRDMYYRKVVPDIIYDDGCGFINTIINRHC